MSEDKQLHGLEKNKILIPESIILNTTMNKYRVAVITYLLCRTGIDYQITFSISRITEWLGKTTDRRLKKDVNNAASGIRDCLEKFKDSDYFSYDKDLKYANMVDGVFNKDEYANNYTHQRFAKIYIDELQTIIDYRSEDTKIDKAMLLLVFALLRARIPVKNNLAGAGERADAYDDHYASIGEEIGLSERLVSKMVGVLIELGLIYELRRGTATYLSYDKEGNQIKKIKEKTYIFCNTYKRIDKGGRTYLIAEGKDYYLKEASEKESELDRKN